MTFLHDIRVASRGLRRSPGFSIVAVATLAVGVGINVAVFTVADASLFKGFRLVAGNDRILYVGTQKNGRGCCASYPDFLDWRAEAKSFSDIGAVADLQITLSDGQDAGAEHYDATQITTNGFRLLGQQPMLGRDFAPGDAQPGAADVAILREAFWERRYGKDPGAIGRVIRINGVPTTIIGVMPRGFAFPQNEDLWLPLKPTPDVDKRDARGLWFAFGRLADGATFERAQTELQTIGSRLAAAYPDTNGGWTPQPRTFAQFFIGRDASAVYGALWGGVTFVLLIACANVANLILGRASGRAREIAVRMAIGADRWRIARLLLVEAVMLSALGGLSGRWIATWIVRAYAVTANPPARLWSADLLDFAVDSRVVLYLFAVSLGTALLCALAPVPSLTRFDVGAALKSGRGSAGSVAHHRWSNRLIVCEMALAVVLLSAAGVMVRSFLSMATADVGVRSGRVASMFMSLPQARYRDAAAQTAFFDHLATRLAAAPGIESLSIAIELPASSVRAVQYEVAGSSPVDAARRPTTPLLVIGPRYFETLGAALTAGRDFTDFDNASSSPVAIVNRQFANTHWPGADPIGRRVRLFDGPTSSAWLTVVGVASDIVQNTGDRTVHDPVVYRPFRQQPRRAMWVIMRSDLTRASLAATVRREVHAIDSALPIWIGPAGLNELMAAMGNYWRLGQNAALFGVFASVALGLAAIGLYAVVVSSVQRRTQEIGIRIAIGASRQDVLGFVFRQGLLPAGVGLTIGLGLSLAVTPVLKTQLVRVPAVDPIALVAAAVLLVFAAAVGCAVPALRAMRIDPIVALRQD